MDALHNIVQRLAGSVHQHSQLLFNTSDVPAMVIPHIKARSGLKSKGGGVKTGSCKEILD